MIFWFGASFGESAFDVDAGALIGAHAGGDAPEGVVGLPVATSVEPVADGAGRGVDRGDTAEVGEGRLGGDPFGVVAGGASSRAAVCTPTPGNWRRLGAVARTRRVSSAWRWAQSALMSNTRARVCMASLVA